MRVQAGRVGKGDGPLFARWSAARRATVYGAWATLICGAGRDGSKRVCEFGNGHVARDLFDTPGSYWPALADLLVALHAARDSLSNVLF